MNKNLFAAIEAGGTKFNCAIATSASDILSRVTIPTTTPEETLAKIIDFFSTNLDKTDSLVACGLATFGPVDLDKSSASYGHILATPKIAWQNTNIVGVLNEALRVPVAVDTDVNAAALAEYHYSAAPNTSKNMAKNSGTLVYVTIGTGIGVGIVQEGKTLKSPMHPEAGHMYVPQDLSVDPFSGVCPFHGGCLEGLASGTSLHKRWGKLANDLSDDHKAWEIEANYLALMCVNLFRLLAPEKIVLGGGVMSREHLLPMIHSRFVDLMGAYHTPPVESIENLILTPILGSDAGLLGACLLADSSLDSIKI